MTEKKKIAIITGASVGLGAEFAKQIEAKFLLNEVWLIARRESSMKELAKEFKKTPAVILPCDLTKPHDMHILEKKIQAESPDISILVNNAGYGKVGPFSELGKDEQLQMIDLNIRSLTELSYLCIPHMRRGASIIQVASSIAYSPAPYFAVYAATKSYVLSLSLALEKELHSKGIHVMAVCPGPVATEFQAVALSSDFVKKKQKKIAAFNGALAATPDAVVKKALRDLDRKKLTSIYGMPIQLFARMAAFIPHNFLMNQMAKRIRE